MYPANSIMDMEKKCIDYFPGVILVADAQGKIVYVSRSIITTLTIEDLLQMSIYDLVEQKHLDVSASIEALQTQKTAYKYITGELNLPILTISKPIMDEAGVLKYVFAYSFEEPLISSIQQELQNEKGKNERILTYIQKLESDDAPISNNHKMQEIIQLCRIIAETDGSVMVYGESGSGKEVISRFIHNISLRKKHAFIPVNCANIPHELMETEFFGYEKNSFTGAAKDGKIGLFELADQGTLFLDEIAEMDLSLQAKLLRVLESGELRRVGGNTFRSVDVRIIAATNEDLNDKMREGLFRRDLFFRLNVLPMRIPPIRERPEDIELFAKFFLAKYNLKYKRQHYFLPQTLETMQAYDWPGNVREIRNVVERLVITSTSNELAFSPFLPMFNLTKDEPAPPGNNSYFPGTGDIKPLKKVMQRYEEAYLQHTMDICGNDVVEAARLLGIHPSGLYKKIAESRKGQE